MLGLLGDPSGDAQEAFLDAADRLKKEVRNFEGTKPLEFAFLLVTNTFFFSDLSGATGLR